MTTGIRSVAWLLMLACHTAVFADAGSGSVAARATAQQPAGSHASVVGSLVIDVDYEDNDGIYIPSQPVAFSVVTEIPAEKPNFNLVCIVTTDNYAPVDSMAFAIEPDSAGKLRRTVVLSPTAAGFYRISVYATDGMDKSKVRRFNIGYDPENIVSPPDPKADFWNFWDRTRAELDSVPPRFRMTRLDDRSSGRKDIYHVEMHSLGNVKIEGYYAVPKKAGKHPALIKFMGYGANPRFPEADSLPDFCEFILYSRGQGIQKAANTYGEWIVNGLEDKDTYYYRGAYMDLIRGIDFLESRPEVDRRKIVAEGGSQGGAFTMAACALDKRIKAAAPRIPFMSDFRDYFGICPWPRSVFERYLKEHPGQSWEDIYDVLSYFDIRNLSGRISCPVIMGVGLQDETCPPHTNFAGYNLISSEKEYIVYPDQGHNVGGSWWTAREAFLRNKLNLPQSVKR